MKLISLNIWGGKAFAPLMDFIKKQAKDTDIFCFQEVFSAPRIRESQGFKTNILADLRKILPDFKGRFAPIGSGSDNIGSVKFTFETGQAVFIRKKILLQVNPYSTVFVDDKKRKLLKGDIIKEISTIFQYLRFKTANKSFTVCNFHGYPYPGSKLDTNQRLTQSQKIIEFLNHEDGAKILCGDFNLLPETKSIEMIEQKRMINLIKTFKIERTRSKLSPFYGKKSFQRFADYVFVSPEVKVLDFEVPDVNVSDHLPLILEFQTATK